METELFRDGDNCNAICSHWEDNLVDSTARPARGSWMMLLLLSALSNISRILRSTSKSGCTFSIGRTEQKSCREKMMRNYSRKHETGNKYFRKTRKNGNMKIQNEVLHYSY